MATSKRWGLRLDMPGAPNTAHTVPNISGYFYPDAPTPVGEVGELPLEAAKEYDADKGCPLELIEIKPSEVDDAEQLAVESVREGRKGLQVAHRDGFKGAEKARAADEADAQKEVNDDA